MLVGLLLVSAVVRPAPALAEPIPQVANPDWVETHPTVWKMYVNSMTTHNPNVGPAFIDNVSQRGGVVLQDHFSKIARTYENGPVINKSRYQMGAKAGIWHRASDLLRNGLRNRLVTRVIPAAGGAVALYQLGEWYFGSKATPIPDDPGNHPVTGIAWTYSPTQTCVYMELAGNSYVQQQGVPGGGCSGRPTYPADSMRAEIFYWPEYSSVERHTFVKTCYWTFDGPIFGTSSNIGTLTFDAPGCAWGQHEAQNFYAGTITGGFFDGILDALAPDGPMGKTVPPELAPLAGGDAHTTIPLPQPKPTTIQDLEDAIESPEGAPVRRQVEKVGKVIEEAPGIGDVTAPLPTTPGVAGTPADGQDVQHEPTPQPQPGTVLIPQPFPGETYYTYVKRLQDLGLVGKVEVASDAMVDPFAGPNVVLAIDPRSGTSVATGTEVRVIVNPATAPEAPADGSTGTTNPGTGVPGTAGCDAWVSPSLDFGPLAAIALPQVFPFGLPWWVADLASTWIADPVTPAFTLYFPHVGDWHVSLAIFDPIMPTIRAVMLVLAVVSMVWFFVSLAYGVPLGGSKGSDD